ncbi:MAG: type II toxin-antitoxin system VapB family antitoxin [Microbacterium sp.]|nr:type II toxin-antitoxin system VapB family antitoxin [Microbacterium sp.]
MTRTNIDIDDELVAAVMRRYGLKTKREAVDLALRKAAPPPVTTEYLLSLSGAGWAGLSLEEIRGYGRDASTEVGDGEAGE